MSVLALLQRAEARSPYEEDADKWSHEEVVRSLAMGGRSRISGAARARRARLPANDVDVETVGTSMGVALSSLAFFASGVVAVVLAAGLVGIALLASGAVAGLLSGTPMLLRALRQLLIGFGAAAVTYVLGPLFHAAGIRPGAAREPSSASRSAVGVPGSAW